LVTHGVPGTLAAKWAMETIPIVVGVVGEAVAIEAVEGLARPGGNVTGSSFFVPELNAKRLEVLKEAFPRLSRVGVLLNRDNAVNIPEPGAPACPARPTHQSEGPTTRMTCS
jgi:ABC-type uncharacterized transport system substrate-binding protein